MSKFKYTDELPPLSEAEREALKEDLKANGQLSAIIVDEDGNILDGRHRWEILTRMRVEKWTETVKGLSELEKRAYPHNSQNTRRNMTPEQKAVQRERMKALAGEMNADEWTQNEIAVALGVSQQTISGWLATNTNNGNGVKKDARAKLSQEDREEIKQRAEEGETQEAIAEDFPVGRTAVAKVIAEETQPKRKHRKPTETLSTQFANALDKIVGIMATIKHEHGGWFELLEDDNWDDNDTDMIAGYLKSIADGMQQLKKDVVKWEKTCG